MLLNFMRHTQISKGQQGNDDELIQHQKIRAKEVIYIILLLVFAVDMYVFK